MCFFSLMKKDHKKHISTYLCYRVLWNETTSIVVSNWYNWTQYTLDDVNKMLKQDQNNNETNKLTKKNGYLPRKNKSYLPDPKSVSFPNKHKTKNKSYLPDPGNSSSKIKSKSKSYLPLSGLSLPPPPPPSAISPHRKINN